MPQEIPPRRKHEMSETLRIGTLGAAGITPAALMAPASENEDVEVIAVAARDKSRANAFAQRFDIPTVHDTYDDVISDSTLDIIYNPLPIHLHHEYSIKALRAGKHVLCEKSFSMNADEAREMAQVAEETGLVLIEAFHYRYHPVFLTAIEIFDSGVLGKIRELHAEFTVGTPNAENIRMHHETGGGATMDMGCYPISWVRHIMREEPKVTAAAATTGNPQVDMKLEVSMMFSDGAEARTIGSMCDPGFSAYLLVTGENGALRVQNPLVPQHGNKIELTIDGEKIRDEELTRRPTYSYQLEAFVDAVKNGTKLPTDAEDAIKQMELIDAAYIAAGLEPRRTT
ncbi:MAG: Gfo/Idh/MocA family oxidoreductase [Gammaproteobacteria bacterium]|nr:Gfo/Idh/MocA family oxidoreductase [Gammaproteobacteria bacterium]MYD79957.1 Gfo/Idh/MocA family oxidoreductase [Gammaproteobacteria bacterium]